MTPHGSTRPWVRGVRAAAVVTLLAMSVVIGGSPASAATNPDLCYIVADDGGGNGGNDLLVSFDRTSPPASPVFTQIGTGTGTNDIEASDLWPGNDTLYAVDADELGTIDLTTGVYTTLGAPFGTADGAAGNVTISDADGIAFDPFEFFIWATERNSGVADYLFKIDPLTGAIIDDAFGPGVDYVISTPAQPGSLDLDDIAVSTVTGEIFAIANSGGSLSSQFLVTIDPDTGAQTEVGALGVEDIEGLTFSPFGNLYATDGTNELFYDIDPVTGAAGNVRTIGLANDYESVTCLTGDVNTVSGTVFVDVDADGVLDPGDDGEPGVTVELVRDTNGNGVADPGEPVLGERVTDANGDYDFEIAGIGDFVVRVDPATLPAGATPTTDTAHPVTFTDVGQSAVDQDFGIDLSATVGDFVFLDLDADGVQDAGEPGIEGVTVELFDAGGASLGTTTTDANGAYSFDVIGGDDYTIVVTPPAGGTFTGQDVGGDDAVDSDVDASGSTGTITPSVGANPQLGDAGIVPASIGDFVFADTDRDGIQDAGETGIGGVTVELLDAGGTVIDTTTTAGDGSYTFDGLVPGADYSVRVTPPAGSAFSPQDQGGDDTVDSDVDADGVTATITPVSGPNPDVGDAGIDLDPPTGSIGDLVFSDDDGDGIQDPGEAGISGVTVNLLDAGGAVIATTTTDTDGTYLFDGLTPGDTYRIEVVAPAGRSFSPQDAGGDDTVDSDVDAAGLTPPIVVVAGTDLDIGDAGILPAPVVTAAIGDLVFSDDDGDGIQDAGEAGIAGVTVELLDAGGAVIATTSTAADGTYLFDGLTPGDTYRVRVTPPAGRSFSPQDAGVDDTVDSDVDAAGLTSPIVAVAGTDLDVGDAGIAPSSETASIGDLVFLDLDGDGVQDAGEPGVPGIVVELLDAGGAVIATTRTDTDGTYEFDELTPGTTYSVRVDAPAGADFTGQDVGGDDAVDSDVDASGTTGAITPAVGSNPQVADAGILPAVLRGRIFSDTDRDGTQDPGERGVAGITVTLVAPDGSRRTATTDADGNYEFAGVVPGPGYRVTFSSGAAFSPPTGADSDVDANGTVTIALVSGVNVGAGDAGIVPAARPLPRTGSSIGWMLQLGSGIVLAGAAMALAGKRRTRMS